MEAAVPPYKADANAAAQSVGELYLYVKQLTTRIGEIADQANRVDDVRLELEKRVEQLTTELAEARKHNDDLRTRIDELLAREDDADCDCCR
jgi:chromosome segregation ATPase